MTYADDNDIMTQVQNGDLNKLGILYERHKKDLFKYFYRCTNDSSRSEDLVQNVFESVIKFRMQFKGTGQFSYWLFAIARNTWIGEFRKKNPLRQSVEIDAQVLAFQSDDDLNNKESIEEQKSHLKSALQKISPEKRDAIVMSRYHGMPYREIAEISRCTENAIKSRVQRGLLELRTLIPEFNS